MSADNSEDSSTTQATGSKRVNVVFSADQFNQLQSLANSQKISLSDALRQAISLSGLIVDANNDKDTQILLKKGSNVQEVKLVR
ncbi:hypothetical protein RBB77_23330 (plasmid) [Tunturibacter psychrotolerans]|uniref:CopG family transcriptional regulator n=1 Tax=Tunturiibacter psychrotolerans TaxID=3069686 RepID=A0AAU7ZXV0_9BACT